MGFVSRYLNGQVPESCDIMFMIMQKCPPPPLFPKTFTQTIKTYVRICVGVLGGEGRERVYRVKQRYRLLVA